jgi:site-specific recombinase XerD
MIRVTRWGSVTLLGGDVSALSKVLREHRRTQSSRKFVFCKKDGNKLTYAGVRWGIWRACDKTSMDRFQWHHLRHSFTSHLVMAGVGLRQVQELMGLKTLEMTMRYAHLDKSSLEIAVEKLTEVKIHEKTEPDLRVVKGSA